MDWEELGRSRRGVTSPVDAPIIRQTYKSDIVKGSSATKTLKLVRSGERWLIKQERVGG